MLAAAERPLIVAGGGIINADAADLLVEFAELTGVPVDPDPDGLGHHPRRPPADGRHGRPADLAPLRQRHHAGSPTSCSASATAGPTGTPAALDVYTHGPQVRARRHRADPDRPGVRPRLRHRLRRQGRAGAVRRGGPRTRRRRRLPDRGVWVEGVPAAQAARMQRRTHFDNVPIKPQRVYEEMNQAFGRGHPLRHARSACRRSPAPSSCTSTSRGTGSTPARPARWAGPLPAALGRRDRRPGRDRRGAVRRLRLPVHDRGAGGRRAVQAARTSTWW